MTKSFVAKPWGFEIVWASTDQYVGKILHMNAGRASSIQYHERKDKTLHVVHGELDVWTGTAPNGLDKVTLREGDGLRIRPGVVHRLEPVTDAEVLEVSSPHLSDLVRVEDGYGRIPAGPAAQGVDAD